MKKNHLLTYRDRQTLERLLKKSVAIPKIAEEIGCNFTTLYKELRKNLSAEDYKQRRYYFYNALQAQLGAGHSRTVTIPEKRRQESFVDEQLTIQTEEL